MSAVCAAPVFAATRRTAPVVTRAGKSDGARAAGLSRRGVVLSFPALLAASTAPSAMAVAPPAYYDDTMEIIALTQSIISGSDLSDANVAKFQEKRDIWYGNYQLHHEKGVGYGYANTFNAQAKVGFQIRVFQERGEPFDPDRTAYNKDYLLKILQTGKDALDEMRAKNQI